MLASRVVILLFVVCVPEFASARPTVEWSRAHRIRMMARSLAPVGDDGYVAIGTDTVDEVRVTRLVRFELDGDVRFVETLDRSAARIVESTSDGGFILVGTIDPGNNIQVIKATSKGVVEWDQTFGDLFAEGHSIAETPEGFVAFATIQDVMRPRKAVHLLPFGVNGELGELSGPLGIRGPWMVGEEMRRASDGGFVMAGNFKELGDVVDFALIKADSDRQVLWDRVYGEDGGESVHELVEVVEDGHEGYALTVSRGQQALLLKVDRQGEFEWESVVQAEGVALGLGVTGRGEYAIGIGPVLGSDRASRVVWTDSSGAVSWEIELPDGFRLGSDRPLLARSDGSVVLLGNLSGRDQVVLTKLVADSAGARRPFDCNQDGDLNLSDPVCLLQQLFQGIGGPLPCGEELSDRGNLTIFDANGDGRVDLADPIAVLNYLFLAAKPPVLGVDCVRIPGCSDLCGRE